ncbi:MAG: hypothetical protein ACYDCC_04775 [Actinomycetota bacterium]
MRLDDLDLSFCDPRVETCFPDPRRTVHPVTKIVRLGEVAFVDFTGHDPDLLEQNSCGVLLFTDAEIVERGECGAFLLYAI